MWSLTICMWFWWILLRSSRIRKSYVVTWHHYGQFHTRSHVHIETGTLKILYKIDFELVYKVYKISSEFCVQTLALSSKYLIMSMCIFQITSLYKSWNILVPWVFWIEHIQTLYDFLFVSFVSGMLGESSNMWCSIALYLNLEDVKIWELIHESAELADWWFCHGVIGQQLCFVWC